jgi:lipopolysaccharide assembly outer membrane protein LptD (OstA)
LINFVVSLSVVFLSIAVSCAQDSIFKSKTFDNKNTEIIADKTSFDKKHSEFLASGNVKVVSKFKNGDRIEASGRFAKYNTNSGKGKLWGKNTLVKYFVKGSSTPFIMLAKEIKFDKNGENIKAYGDVFIVTSSGTIRSDNVLFDQKISGAVFEKDKIRPVAEVVSEGRKQLYEANKMIFYDTDDGKKIFMEGNVKGKIEMENTINDTKN